jgi:hypothetical protein
MLNTVFGIIAYTSGIIEISNWAKKALSTNEKSDINRSWVSNITG